MRISTLVKQPSENRMFEMSFAGKLGLGESLTGVVSVVVIPAGLTLSGAATVNGVSAFQRIMGGTAGVVYKVTYIVTTSAGNTLEGEGRLQVKDE